jgi:hypothetical protein
LYSLQHSILEIKKLDSPIVLKDVKKSDKKKDSRKAPERALSPREKALSPRKSDRSSSSKEKDKGTKPEPVVSDTIPDGVRQNASTRKKKHTTVVYTDEEEQPVNESELEIFKEREVWDQEEYDEFFTVAGIPGKLSPLLKLTPRPFG